MLCQTTPSWQACEHRALEPLVYTTRAKGFWRKSKLNFQFFQQQHTSFNVNIWVSPLAWGAWTPFSLPVLDYFDHSSVSGLAAFVLTLWTMGCSSAFASGGTNLSLYQCQRVGYQKSWLSKPGEAGDPASRNAGPFVSLYFSWTCWCLLNSFAPHCCLCVGVLQEFVFHNGVFV